MPYAEFDNGNAGLALGQFQQQAQDHAASLMERAQRMRVSQFELEKSKQMLAGELAIQDSDVKQHQIRVEQMRNEVKTQQNALDLAGHRLKAENLAADNEAALQKAIADARVANSSLLASLPDDLKALQNIKPEDRNSFITAWANLQTKYGHLAGDQYFGQKYHALVAPALGEAAMRNTSFQLMVQNSAAQLSAKLARAKTAAELGEVDRDPLFAYVRQADPNFVKSYDERLKQLNELDIKKMEAQIQRAKDDRSQGLQQNDKFESNPNVVSFRKAEVGYNDAMHSLETERPTNYTDMAALTAFFKIIDPTMGFNASQEEIFKNLQNRTDRWSVQFKNLYTNKAGLLTPETRKDLRDAVETTFKSQVESYNSVRESYAKGLETAGNTTDYLPDARKPKGKDKSQQYVEGQKVSVKTQQGDFSGTVVRSKKDGGLYVVDPATKRAVKIQ